MRDRNGDWSIPGTRNEGEVKRIRSEGAGRTSRYCLVINISTPYSHHRTTYILVHAF